MDYCMMIKQRKYPCLSNSASFKKEGYLFCKIGKRAIHLLFDVFFKFSAQIDEMGQTYNLESTNRRISELTKGS